MPRITLMLILIVVGVYIIGARWPMLAQKVGLA